MKRVPLTLSIEDRTLDHIKKIGEITHRAQSHVIDWLVAEKWAEMAEEGPETLDETIEHLR
ncbi:MAG: hypothetical protein ABFD50_22265 [Smithella sp.]